MTGGPDHSGDAVRQRLAEIYDGRGENDPLADYALYDAALTAVLDLTAKYRHGALRWADPLPVPEWVDRVEQAIAAALEERS